MTTEEIEVNFRLDSDGRTIPTVEVSSSYDNQPVFYDSTTVTTEFVTVDGRNSRETIGDGSAVVDDLLFDCEISDSALMPRTFWMPVQGLEPRCSLEQMALDVFHRHAAQAAYHPATSGAEWWVQIRPSPDKIGRYTVLAPEHEDDDDDMAKTGISFHWDKDEDLRLLCGGTTYVHPHISTVTYLTSLGAPTMAINYRVNNLSGEWIRPSSVEGFVSWPSAGKHLSFDGRFLHAAPPNLMEPGVFDIQCRIPSKDSQGDLKRLQRRHRRVTFLVNVWLNYHPFGIEPFPATMLDKMSGTEGQTVGLNFRSALDSEFIEVEGDRSKPEDTHQQRMVWPMGDCDSGERIEAMIPLSAIRSKMSRGGNLFIQWKSEDAVQLIKHLATVEDNPTPKRQKIDK